MNKIEQSIALVTGANRGIGKAIVEELLARGASKVYAGVRNTELANSVKIEIEAQAIETEAAEPQTAAAVASQSSVQGGADRRALDD